MEHQNVTIVRSTDAFSSTTVMLERLGYEYDIRVLKNQVIEANKLISLTLGLPLASPVCEIRRLLSVERCPKAIEISYIPYAMVRGMERKDLSGCSLYRLMREEYAIHICESEEEILIAEASEEEIRLLGLPQGSDVMVIDGVATDQRGKRVESYQTIAVTDFYIFRSVTTE